MSISAPLRNYYRQYMPKKFQMKMKRMRGIYCYSELNDKTKTLFIHIPKTAGSSVSKALFSNMNSGHKHFCAQDYHDESKEKFESYFKFAFIRHPIDRFVSAYKFLSSLPEWVSIENQNFSKQYVTQHGDINAFINAFVVTDSMKNWVHFKPQSSFISVNGKISMDFIGRFESIDDDLNNILDTLQKPRIILPHVNKSKLTIDDSYSLNLKSIELLAEHYKDDFYNFGYKLKVQ